MHNQRNIVLALVLSALLLFGWDMAMQYFYPQPVTATGERVDTPAERAARNPADGSLAAPQDAAALKADLASALAQPGRVRIDGPRLAGSILLKGAVIDDLVLKDHREATNRASGPVRLFSPAGTPAQQYARFGWVGSNIAVPGPDTVWQAEGTTLTPRTPVTLRWNNGQGLTFAIRLTIDDTYLVTAEQSIANTGPNPVVVQPYGFVTRTSSNASADIWNVHSGPIGLFDGAVDFDVNYEDLDESTRVTPAGRAGWAGFTDIYWMSILAPQAGSASDATYRRLGSQLYRAELVAEPETVPAGRSLTTKTRLFAGAKDSAVLNAYEAQGFDNLSLAIDWGWFRWIAKPTLALLNAIFSVTANFGLAIIGLTIIVRLLMFPIAQKQFASMAAMKALQPKMKAIQDRYKDDKPTQQQKIMELYREEKVNPLAGCLPILIQIPIFFALYKVLILAVEMRHQPFLYIRDLAAPDPATVLNLFGLLPFTPPGFLAIGVLAVLLGVTMWLTFKMNPAAMDPIQQQIFSLMPWLMMFVMAPFSAGLLLYWVTSNVLTIAQQKYLYSKHPGLRAQAEADKAKAAEA